MGRLVADDLKNISVYKFKEWGLLDNPSDVSIGQLTWSNNGYVTSQMMYKLTSFDKFPEELKLDYSASVTGKAYNPAIKMSSTPCNYGGWRHWFNCPNCFSKSAKLYLCDYNFYCRKCLNLTYEVNNRTRNYRKLDLIFGTLKAEEYRAHLNRTKRYWYAGEPTKKFKSYLKHKKTEEDLALFEKYMYNSSGPGRPRKSSQ